MLIEILMYVSHWKKKSMWGTWVISVYPFWNRTDGPNKSENFGGIFLVCDLLCFMVFARIGKFGYLLKNDSKNWWTQYINNIFERPLGPSILRQFDFWLFLTHPLELLNQHKYITECYQNGHFLDPPTQSFADVMYEWPLSKSFLSRLFSLIQVWVWHFS